MPATQLALTPPRKIALPRSAPDVALTALIFFTANTGAQRLANPDILWMGFYALTLLWLMSDMRRIRTILTRDWAAFLLPALALCSTLWSVAPGRTGYASLQLIMTTLIALRMAHVLTTRQILLALFLAQGGGLALSLLNLSSGFLQPVWEVNGALLGIYPHKTGVGKAAFWAALALLGLCAYMRLSLLALIFAAAVFPVAVLAKSVTAQLGFAVVGMLALLIWMRHLPRGLRAGLPLAGVVLLLATIVIFAVTGGDLLTTVLQAMGKSPTLTGRTVLWSFALDILAQEPLGGVGFNAFWTSPRYALLVSYIHTNVDEGLNGFHNAYLEVFVALGLVGGTLLLGQVALTYVRLIRAYLRARSLSAAIWLAIFAAVSGLALMEDSFFKLHSGHYMLAVIAMAYARRVARAAPEEGSAQTE
ncbi:O-antigen ligase family protein [Poseidonocella sedimentorum]|nr:O-antigen ligase family protein [Poseidonocella sedimentorum]